MVCGWFSVVILRVDCCSLIGYAGGWCLCLGWVVWLVCLR